MPEITLTINSDDLLPSYDYDNDEAEQGAELQQLVIEAAARQILRTENFDREVKVAVRQQIDKEVKSAVEELVRGAVAEPFNLTTTWGETKRENVTVRELVREAVEEWFRPPRNSGGYGSSPDRQSLAYLVKETAADVLGAELKAEVARVRKEVGNQIRDKALRAAVEAISPRDY